MQGTVLSPQSVQISWSRPSSNYYHITGYRVSYSNNYYCPFCTSQSMDVNAVSRSLTINNLIRLATYTFNVKAKSVAGLSPSSSPAVTLIIGKPSNPSLSVKSQTYVICSFFVYTAPPSAPPRLSATNLTPTSFTLRWGSPSNTYGHPYSFSISCDETSYSTGPQLIASNLNLNSVSYAVRYLQPGATYWCCVSAVNNAGENTTCTNTHTLERGE